MNLTTHLFFALAVGFLFFGQPGVALLLGFGALLPDLDREYWFMKMQRYRDEQLHRSLFHNFFVIAVVFVFSPFVSLGMFLHTLQDALTTVKDRGVEWLYPATRFVLRGEEDANGNDEALDPKMHVYFYQEDAKGLLENADPDLREVGDKPVPWRRTYGPALNGMLLDTGFLIGSIALMIIWIVLPNSSHLSLLETFARQNWQGAVVGFGAVGLVFAAGEVDRRLRAKTSMVQLIDVSKVVLFVAGIGLGIYGLFNNRAMIYANMTAYNWLFILPSILVVALIAVILIKFKTPGGKNAVV